MVGHCIVVDPWFIISQNSEEARLIHTAREVNDSKPQWVVRKVKERCRVSERAPRESGKGRDHRLFGAADIDDLRGSPSVTVVREIAESFDGILLLVEPVYHNEFKRMDRQNIVKKLVFTRGIETR